MPTPGTKRTDRSLLAFSLAASAYFAFLALDYHWLRLDSVALGIVVELLTIPLIVAVAAALVFAVVRLLRDRRRVNAATVGSVVILFALSCLVWI